MALRTIVERSSDIEDPIAHLWSDEAEAGVLNARYANVLQDRNRAIAKTYHLTLQQCGNDQALFGLCLDIHQVLVYRWQHGHAKSAKFMTHYGVNSVRSKSYVSAADLLLACAKVYHDHSVKTGTELPLIGFFNQKKPHNMCKPNVVFQ